MISICVKCNNLNILDNLKKKLLNSNLEEIIITEHSFKSFSNIIIHCKSNCFEKFYYHFSSILSDLIILYFESILIERILSQNYFYFNKYDIKVITEEIEILKEKKIYDKAYVYSLLFSSIYNYIIQNKVLIISGFVDFRLKKYYSYLEEIVSEAVNQYVIDREYISFVNLLKSYIDSKVPNDIIINLIYINSKGLLLSENGNHIELEYFNNSYLSDISFSTNDYVLNTLIGILPKKVVIHLVSPKDQFIRTIDMIFDSKVYYCEDCALCRAYKTLKLQ